MASHGGGKGALGRHAFKVLCPESLVMSVIGPRGITKDEIQAETGCKLVVSNREDFYPGTRLRVLIIYADQPAGIIACLEQVVRNVGMCSEEEQADPHFNPRESEYLGKEPGEFMLRAAIPTKASGGIIGRNGVKIQAMRDEFNAKVFIEKTVEQGHQVLKLVATLDNMRHAIIRINEAVQDEVRSEDFRHWAALRSFSGQPDAGVDGYGKGSDQYSKGGGGGDRQEPRGGGRARSRSRGREAPSGQGTPMLQVLAATLQDFPDGTLDDQFTVTCDLPRNKVSALIGKSGDHVRSVRRATGTNVRFEEVGPSGGETQTMIIKGKMMDAYRAHALMMRKYHEDDAEAQKNAHLQGLQAQLAELQKQLAQVASSEPVKGTGRPGGRKGK